MTLRDSEIVFGRSIKQTTGEWEFNEGQTPYNAVRVTAQRTPNSADGAVKLFFGQFYGHGDFTPTTTAVASVIDVDICLVLDRSSSMKLPTSSTATGMSSSDSRFCETPHADSRWVALTDAVQLLLTELGGSIADEKVGLVTFASDYSSCGVSSDKVTCDNWLTTNLSDISSSLTTLNSTLWNGATDIEAGIEKGAEALTDPATSRPLAEKIMIVFTDGAYTAADPVPAATAARNQGIIVYTITFGAGARQADMQAVALAGGGKHYHAPDAGSLNAVFLKIAGSITRLTE